MTSGGCKLHNQDLIYSPRFNPGLKLLQQVIMKAVPATVMAGSLPQKSIIEHIKMYLFPLEVSSVTLEIGHGSVVESIMSCQACGYSAPTKQVVCKDHIV